MFKTLFFSFFLLTIPLQAPLSAGHYPHFDGNGYLTNAMKQQAREFLMPLDHPLKVKLDEIFSRGRVIENESTLHEAGFTILFMQPMSFITIVRHPELPGVLLKLYQDRERRTLKNLPGWTWLVMRAEGAKNIRKLIKKRKLKYFTAPEKWIYPLPPHPHSEHNPVVLVVTDMQLASQSKSIDKWKTLSNPKILDELHIILSKGLASTCLPWNIPYTLDRKFACIDTEHPKRTHKMSSCLKYFSPEMQEYWKSIQ